MPLPLPSWIPVEGTGVRAGWSGCGGGKGRSCIRSVCVSSKAHSPDGSVIPADCVETRGLVLKPTSVGSVAPKTWAIEGPVAAGAPRAAWQLAGVIPEEATRRKTGGLAARQVLLF